MPCRIIEGDCREVLRTLEAGSAQTCVTSPPYFGLRDYGVEGQIGLEATPSEFIEAMVQVFREVRRVLADDGTLWLNLGDSYSNGGRATRAPDKMNPGAREMVTRPDDGAKPKDLLMIPVRVALALQADGWWLRSHIIWHKPNPMPESVTDRPTSAHESIFLLTKSERYFYDSEAVRERAIGQNEHDLTGSGYSAPGQTAQSGNRGKQADTAAAAGAAGASSGRRMAGLNARWDAAEAAGKIDGKRNLRNVWTIASQPFSGAHFATFPPALIEPCIKAGSRPNDMVLDPFGGAGTTGLVADRLGRRSTLIELNPSYAAMARERIAGDAPLFAEVAS